MIPTNRAILIVSELLLLNYLANSSPEETFDNRIHNDSERQHDREEGSEDSWSMLKHHPRGLKYLASSGIPYLPEDIYDEDVDAHLNSVNGKFNRNYRSSQPEYSNLCETVRRRVELESDDSNYEYQPPDYQEVICKSYFRVDGELQKSIVPSKQKCAHPSFHCVQRTRTLLYMRRRLDSDCWEPKTVTVASGCDCMWPVTSLGDISIHY